jgi:hypothetical protein
MSWTRDRLRYFLTMSLHLFSKSKHRRITKGKNKEVFQVSITMTTYYILQQCTMIIGKTEECCACVVLVTANIIKLPKSNVHILFECVEHEATKTGGRPTSKNWTEELIHVIDFNHGLLGDLRSMLEYKYRIEDLKAKSSICDQRDRLLDLMEQSPTGIPQFFEALRTTGQEHVANFITRNGCKYSSIYLFIFECFMLSTISSHTPSIATLNNIILQTDDNRTKSA